MALAGMMPEHGSARPVSPIDVNPRRDDPSGGVGSLRHSDHALLWHFGVHGSPGGSISVGKFRLQYLQHIVIFTVACYLQELLPG